MNADGRHIFVHFLKSEKNPVWLLCIFPTNPEAYRSERVHFDAVPEKRRELQRIRFLKLFEEFFVSLGCWK